MAFKNWCLQKSMIIALVILSSLFFFLSCFHDKKEFDLTCNKVTNSGIDTVTQWTLSIERNRDLYSFLYYQNIKNSYKFETAFDKTNCTLIAQKDTFYLDFVQTKVIKLNNINYIVYSYRYSDLYSIDSSVNFFMTKEFGVLNAVNKAWDNKFIIFFLDKKYHKVVAKLNQTIMEDTVYYWYDNELPPILD